MVWVLASFIVVTVVAYLVLVSRLEDARLQRRLDRATFSRVSSRTQPDIESQRDEGKPGFWRRWQGGWGKLISVEPGGGLGLRLHRAGIPLKEGEFLVFNAFIGIVSGLLGLIFCRGRLYQTLLFLFLGLILPQLHLLRKERVSMSALSGQIADSLILMANSLRAGHSFLQSMEMVAREMPPPISREFSRALQEMNLGIPVETALAAMGQRAGNEDLELMITAVLIQRQVGGNLAEILDTIAETIRERVRIQGEIKTLTAQGRISGVIVCLLPLAIGGFIAVINPGYLDTLFTHPLGKTMIGIGVMGQLLGIFAIRKIIQIDV
ncbi:MAG: secretion system protein [Firmicutes bacterium]|nr:secretion system protein [Bacillota bacterium]